MTQNWDEARAKWNAESLPGVELNQDKGGGPDFKPILISPETLVQQVGSMFLVGQETTRVSDKLKDWNRRMKEALREKEVTPDMLLEGNRLWQASIEIIRQDGKALLKEKVMPYIAAMSDTMTDSRAFIMRATEIISEGLNSSDVDERLANLAMEYGISDVMRMKMAKAMSEAKGKFEDFKRAGDACAMMQGLLGDIAKHLEMPIDWQTDIPPPGSGHADRVRRFP